MRKPSPSKLDQYAESLLAMDAELNPRKTLDDMLAWLKQEGVTVSKGQLSKFLTAQRSARQQQSLLDSIVLGARQVKEVDKRFEKHTAPQLDTLIKLLRVSILQLATQAQTNPDLLKLVDQLTRTVMEFVSGQTKAMHKERELAVAEEKLELLKKKAEQADEAKGIMGNQALSEAEKSDRMRELFGR
jgi:hypothetical protein